MKRKLLRACAMFMAVILVVSSETPYVFAEENAPQEASVANDMEISIPDEEDIEVPKGLAAEELAVEAHGDEIVLYGGEESQIAAISEAESNMYYGTISGCLSKTGDYALYQAELPAGSYLQARLSLPNSTEIDYDLVLYDSTLSVIKASDYLTYLNATGTLAESIGYKAATDENVYIGVFSSLGGSATEEYTLEFSITTNFSESSEPNENAKEAAALNLGEFGTTVSGVVNSAIDNDWYSFTVLDSPKHDKIRLNIISNSDTNGCNIEVYRRLSSDYFGMQFLTSGKGGEIKLPAGKYYLRIVSTNTLSNFDASAIPSYELSVTPVGKVDNLEITAYSGYKGIEDCEYAEGIHYRTYEVLNMPNVIVIYGRAYYQEGPNQYAAKNVIVNAVITDKQWENTKPEWVTVYGSAITNDNGAFEMKVYLNPPRGGLEYIGSRFIHVYDLMDVKVTATSNNKVECIDHFYYEINDNRTQ